MCGIIGYIGKNEAMPVLLEGLKRLEYRGYDSAGIAVHSGQNIIVKKAVGKIKELEGKLDGKQIAGNLGIAHTRWATHGEPTEKNAHPHTDCKKQFWVAHNGIIENYQALKKWLETRGHIFQSETDTEIIPHLLEELHEGNINMTIQKAVKMLKGAFGLVVLHKDYPDKLIVARLGSPLVIGLGEDETIVASDVSAIIRYTKQVIFLNDGEIAVVNHTGLKILDFDLNELSRDAQKIEWDISQAEKNGFPHFMLKEIFEQPDTIENSVRGRLVAKDGKVKLGGLESVKEKLHNIEKIIIVACGTARNAGLVGEYMLEEYAGLSVEVDYASEFRYRKPVLDKKTAILAISQSGETADTLAAIKEGKEKNILTLGIVNTVGSTIARTTDAGVYNHIGPEISVASTKAFTSQVAIMALITILFGRQRDLSLTTGKRIQEELMVLPKKIKEIINQSEKIKKIAEKYFRYENFFYLGRKYNQPVAAEGALKLKEISYIHAEGLPAGEMKHGSISLINRDFPCLVLAPLDSVYEKNASNIEEIKARRGKIIAVTTEGNDRLDNLADDLIYIPKTLEMLTPILSVIPLQLFAYHMASLRGCDIDKPRNLAKSVTVE